MRAIAGITALLLMAGCATQKGNDRHAQHAADQIKMIAVQREAQLKEAQAESATQVALVEALAEVAKANPDHAPSVAVALAVIGVRGSETASQDAPVIGLQRQENEALEWTKALAPTVGTLVSGLGVAAINASVTKNAQDANRDIMLGDQAQNARIVEAVAGLGTAAANNSGVTAEGDVYQVSDNGFVDQSTDNITSYTATDDAFINTGVNDWSDRIVEYSGSAMSVDDLIALLNSQGASYSIDLDGDGTPDYTGGSGGGQTVYVNCDAVQFSPKPPVCS